MTGCRLCQERSTSNERGRLFHLPGHLPPDPVLPLHSSELCHLLVFVVLHVPCGEVDSNPLLFFCIDFWVYLSLSQIEIWVSPPGRGILLVCCRFLGGIVVLYNI